MGEQQFDDSEDDDEDESDIRLYHCTDKEIENLNKYNSMHKLCENIEDFQCSYNLLINDDTPNINDIFYSFHSLKKQWMTMIIINCNEKDMFDVTSLKLTPTTKEYLSLNELNYKYIFLWLSIIYISL